MNLTTGFIYNVFVMRIIEKISDWFMGAEPCLPPDLGRNEPCHCGSELKYKRCCLGKDQKLRVKAAAAACCTTST